MYVCMYVLMCVGVLSKFLQVNPQEGEVQVGLMGGQYFNLKEIVIHAIKITLKK